MNYLRYIELADAETPPHFNSAINILLYQDFISSVNHYIKQINIHITKYNQCNDKTERLALLKSIFIIRETMNALYPLDFIAYCPLYQKDWTLDCNDQIKNKDVILC